MITVLISALCLISITLNALFVWYIFKLLKTLKLSVSGLDDFQMLLDEYAERLGVIVQLDQFYGDEAILSAIKDTKMVIEASKFFKNAVLEEEPEKEKLEDDPVKTG